MRGTVGSMMGLNGGWGFGDGEGEGGCSSSSDGGGFQTVADEDGLMVEKLIVKWGDDDSSMVEKLFLL
ncbi:hypothetical protein V6N12_002667 [Hibiscus sabdariffa]|uniref:Uncharacterized protein n=1 Tax=Hibiscus sabdariffa TaxID=183260 RepID=A0ABR2EBH6_9ROSI